LFGRGRFVDQHQVEQCGNGREEIVDVAEGAHPDREGVGQGGVAEVLELDPPGASSGSQRSGQRGDRSEASAIELVR
jgi:hypothetical protein